MTTFLVHTSPTCGRCTTLLNLMARRGIEHSTVDVTADPEAHARITALGYHELPVTTRHDDAGNLIDHWPGYNPDKLRNAA